MTDPRNTDPRRHDYQFSDPVRRHEQSVDRMWGWIAGLAVVVLIVFIVIVGWNASAPTTASNTPRQSAPAVSTTGQAPSTRPAPSPAPGQSAPGKPLKLAPTTPPPSSTPNGGTQ
jgi:hypothetical protein